MAAALARSMAAVITIGFEAGSASTIFTIVR